MAETPQRAPGHENLRRAIVAIPLGLVLSLIGITADADSGIRVLVLFGNVIVLTGIVLLVIGLRKKLE